jgi:dTDP-4-dehydrorhamnose 3,5-epimerase
MKIEVVASHLNGIKVLRPEHFEDERGFFHEIFRADQFAELGLPTVFVQQNHSSSQKGVLRGLHFQWDPPMSKMMRVTIGEALLVAVDIRKGSPTLGQWVGVEVSASNHLQVWAPPGFARGFLARSDYVEMQYMCTGQYNAEGESGIRWNDPQIGIDWPVTDPILSVKDDQAQSLEQWLARPESDHFKYEI